MAYTNREKELIVKAKLGEAISIFKDIEEGTITHRPFTAIMQKHGVKGEMISPKPELTKAQAKFDSMIAQVQSDFKKLAKTKAQMKVVD